MDHQGLQLKAGVTYTATYYIAAHEAVLNGGNVTGLRIGADEGNLWANSEVLHLTFPVNADTNTTFGWKKVTQNFTVETSGTYGIAMQCFGIRSGVIYVKNISVRYNGDLVDGTFEDANSLSIIRSKWEEANRASFTCDETMSATNDGTGSLKIQGHGTLDSLGRTDGLTTFINFGFNVKAGKTYKVGFDFCADNMADSGANCYTKVFNSSLKADEATSTVTFKAIYWDCLSGKNWDHTEGTFTATEDAEYVLYFQLYGLAGTIWLDNIKVTEVNENVENIPAEKPAAPEKAASMTEFKGEYKDATHTLVLDGAGNGTYDGNAITYAVTSETTISISGIGDAAIVATYNAAALTMTVGEASITVSKNVKTYTVSFVSDNVEVSKKENLSENATITLPDALTKAGYVFAGWDLNGTVYEAGAEFTVTGNCSFTAKWNDVLPETDPLNETFASDAALATVTTNHAGNATYTFDADNTATDDGTGSLKIVGASHSNDPNRDDYFDKADAYFAVTLESGKTYTLTFDYRADNLQEISGAIHFVKVLKPSDGKDGEEKDGYKDNATYASSSGLPKLDWSNLTSGDWNHFDGFTFTATESGTHYIYFRLWQLAGEVRLDNIKVVEVKA